MVKMLLIIMLVFMSKVESAPLGASCEKVFLDKEQFSRVNQPSGTTNKKESFKVIKTIPSPDQFFRENFSFNSKPASNLKVKLATQKEMPRALRILHDSYVEKKLMKVDDKKMRVSKYTYLPTTKTIIATKDKDVIGTVAIVKDTKEHGLPSEKLFDLNNLRKKGKVAEISSLAIDKNNRDGNETTLLMMIKFIANYALEKEKLDYLVITVNPKYAFLYEAIFLFKKIGNTVENYDFVNGAPAVSLVVDLNTIKERYKSTYADVRDPNKNLYNYFFNSEQQRN